MTWEDPEHAFCQSLAFFPSYCVAVIIVIISRQSVNIRILPLPLQRKFAL